MPTNYTIEEELAYLFDPNRDDNFAYGYAREVHDWMWKGKFKGTGSYPQYVNSWGDASFYGILADLEPSRALGLAWQTNVHFGYVNPASGEIDVGTAIEDLTQNVRIGETPETSDALRLLDAALAPYITLWEAQIAESEENVRRSQPKGHITIYE